MTRKSFFMLLATVALAATAVPFESQAQGKITKARLEIYDAETGTRSVFKEYPYQIEAANWTVDGKYLVYNRGGRIYKVEVAAPQNDVLIPTGSVRGCNNDHVLSFDGKGLAVSSSSPEDSSSRIYTLPLEGVGGGEAGEPKLITPLGPSYLHGWSPDGKMLVYTASRRDWGYDIWAVPADGSGPEIRLTTAEGLDDGPEYSPDGRHVWFNSVRSGTMQVWRMRTDGSEQTQMTFDDSRNAWFPHVSPDGKRVVYIAYNAGEVSPGDHPGGKNVELLLMNTTDCGKCGEGCECGEKCSCGEGCECGKWSDPETVVKLFGGQGTINVNSWSPCSRYFAFVSYEYE